MLEKSILIVSAVQCMQWAASGIETIAIVAAVATIVLARKQLGKCTALQGQV